MTLPLRHSVLYFRGLNTQGDEQLRFGRLVLGPMHGPWLKALEKQGVRALAVQGRGGGPLEEQIARAAESILKMPDWRDPQNRFHFLAHSTGGLVARALVHRLNPSRVISVVTLASPHRGSWLADLIPTVPQRRPRINRILQLMNYRIEKKLAAFSDLTAQKMSSFNERYPDLPGIAYGSAIFAVPPSRLSWPVRCARYLVDPTGRDFMDDGIVQRDAQSWGRIWHEGELDHMNQIGYNLRLRLNERAFARGEFKALVENAVAFMSRAEHDGRLKSKLDSE